MLVETVAGAVRIAAVNGEAGTCGIYPGMTLAAARAMWPRLRCRPHDAGADGCLIEAMADWADRYTPLVGRAPPDGLFLDIAGAAHLMGGEGPLMDDLLSRLAAQGITATAAIAPTPGAAWGLARHSPGSNIGADDMRARLAPLPVAALRLPTETVAALRRVGLTVIGDLMDRPRAPIAARFGAIVLHRLDQALGLDDEPISPRQPVPEASVERRLAEPILLADDVAGLARILADDLCAILGDRGQGARQVALSVFRVDGVVRRVAVGFGEPCRSPAVMHDLLKLRLDAIADPLDPGFGFDMIRLAAVEVANRDAVAMTLDATPGAGKDAAALVDGLTARFGAERVLRLVEGDTHVPERAGGAVRADFASRMGQSCVRDGARGRPYPPGGAAPEPPVFYGQEIPRPIRLFERPEAIEVTAEVPDGPPLRLRWRRVLVRVAAAEGPERIAPEWWHDRESERPRDYYRVADELGRRLWVFRQGLYGATGPPPRWFVHGVFS